MISKIYSAEVQRIIKLHQHDDPVMLMLKSKKFSHLPFREIVQQIKSRQKAFHKLPEWYSKEEIVFPPSLSMEQCSSEISARFKASLVSGDTMLDLTGGTGVDTYYFSKKFKSSIYIERNSLLCEIARHNFDVLSCDVKVCHSEAARYLNEVAEPVDFIYIDPARRDERQKKVFLLEDCEPDVYQLQKRLLMLSKSVMIKTSPMLDISLAQKDLNHVKSITIVAIGNEVKEVLYLLERHWVGETEINAKNLNKTSGVVEEEFVFKIKEEEEAISTYALPAEFIYEPNSSVLKSGAFRLVGQRFGLSKLHSNSHLYTSNKLIAFPGRVFECRAVVPYQKKAILKHLSEGKANITTRNFPESVDSIRRKTGLKDGGEFFLFATTNLEERLVVLICTKVSEV